MIRNLIKLIAAVLVIAPFAFAGQAILGGKRVKPVEKVTQKKISEEEQAKLETSSLTMMDAIMKASDNGEATVIRAKALTMGADVRFEIFVDKAGMPMRVLVDGKTGEVTAPNVTLTDAIKTAVHDLTHSYGGSVSAEHGVGRLKVGDLETYADPAKLAAMRAIKAALDPAGIMNPGAVLRRAG